MTAWDYLALGLHIRSAIPLPELPLLVRSGIASDIEVRLEANGAAALEADFPDGYYELEIADIATYSVRNGQEIVIHQKVGASQRDIRGFFYASIWAALCHQRGLLPLHASAVQTEAGTVAFLGDQGAGKSSMAAAMARLGFPLANDDVLVIEAAASGELRAWPFIRRSKLRDDSINVLGGVRAEPETVHVESDKWWMEPPQAATALAKSMHRIYVLERSEAGSPLLIEQLVGIEALTALIEHTFRRQLLHSPTQLQQHLTNCNKLARQCPVYRLQRPFDLAGLPELAKQMSAHIHSHGVNPGAKRAT